MKIALIPRNRHEVFFLPVSGRTPGKKEIREYLARHFPIPLSGRAIDRRICRAGGKRFLMLTLVSPDWRPQDDSFPPAVALTASAIIARTRWAREGMTVRCPDEILRFGDEPASIPGECAPAGIRADIDIADAATLCALARAPMRGIETLEARKRFKKGLLILVLTSIALAGTVGAAFRLTGSSLATAGIYERRDASQGNDCGVSIPGNRERVNRPSGFWPVFKSELSAVFASGGTIRNYSYTAGEANRTSFLVSGGDPIKLDRYLSGIYDAANPSSPEYRIEEISFTEGICVFPVRGNWAEPTEPARTAIPPPHVLSAVADFSDFCRARGYALNRIRTGSTIDCELSISRGIFSRFPLLLEEYCRASEFSPVSISIENAEPGGTKRAEVGITLSLGRISAEDAGIASAVGISPELVEAAFGIERKTNVNTVHIDRPSPRTDPDIHAHDETLVGRITAGSGISTVYNVGEAGKIIKRTKER